MEDSKNDVNVRTSGAIADFDRSEAFLPRVTTVNVYCNFTHQIVKPLTVRLRCGPVFLLNTRRYTGDRSELMLGYGATAGYSHGKWTFDMGFSGRYWMSQNLRKIERETDHQFGISIGYDLGRIRPEVGIRRPSDRDQRALFKYDV